LFFLLASVIECVQAESLILTGPGVKVEKRNGWFGRNSVSYQDALGNKVERSRGLFGGETNRTSVFGSQTVISPRETSVIAPNGTPLVRSRKTWFHGKETQVDGSAILNSFKGILNP
jgi:hypothetical protein